MPDHPIHLQIRPVIPPSGPLLSEEADEPIQPAVRVTFGFTPAWFRDRMGLDYRQPWHTNPHLRRASIIRMRQTLNDRFPTLKLGGDDPQSQPLTLSVAQGTTLMPAMFGQPITYFADNWPVNDAPPLTDDHAHNLVCPDLDNCAVLSQLINQIDDIEQEQGTIEGLLNFQGVLNTAFRLRGQQIFLDILDDPGLARHIFTVVSDTILDVVGRIHARQNASGVKRQCFVTGNCVVNMLAAQQYHELLLPFDQKLAGAFDYFGIHNCAWKVDPYLESYRTISPLSYLDFGLESDLERIARLFPETRRCLMYTPMDLQNKPIDAIADDLVRVHQTLTPVDIIVADIETNCPEDKVVAFNNLCQEIWHDDLIH